jgi:hypothetical protein
MKLSSNPAPYVAQNTAFASDWNHACISKACKNAAQHFHAASAKIALYVTDIVMFVATQALRGKSA